MPHVTLHYTAQAGFNDCTHALLGQAATDSYQAENHLTTEVLSGVL